MVHVRPPVQPRSGRDPLEELVVNCAGPAQAVGSDRGSSRAPECPSTAPCPCPIPPIPPRWAGNAPGIGLRLPPEPRGAARTAPGLELLERRGRLGLNAQKSVLLQNKFNSELG